MAMFSFTKTVEKPQVSVKRDTMIFDYLVKIEKDLGKYRAVMIYVSRLQNISLKKTKKQDIQESLEAISKKDGGDMFILSNEDIVAVYNKKNHDEMMACLIKIRFLLQDDPIVRGSIDLTQSGMASIFDLRGDNEEFRRAVKQSMRGNPREVAKKPEQFSEKEREILTVPFKAPPKSKQEFTPAVLSRVEKILARTDFSNLIRRQTVCAVIGKSTPQMIFDEVYVSIADLRDSLLPDADFASNPWLFQHLTETLDKRVLTSISQHDDGSLKSNFSMNLNVSTILSDEFLAFDETVSKHLRSSIVLELQLVDILSDVKAFVLARTFAQYRGYKICIDSISVDKLEMINREFLNTDLIKIIWDNKFMDFIQESNYFRDHIDPTERAKMILCRVDDPQAIEVGNSLGINLYQGRTIQKMLAVNPKKTIYKV